MGSTRVVFLGGLGRSGSTLIERVLGELPGYYAAGELTHLWQWGILDNEHCGCGDAFATCPFWAEVGHRAFGARGWTEAVATRMLRLRAQVDRMRHLPQLMAPTSAQVRASELAAYLAGYRALYAAIAEVSGAEIVVDSSKHASMAFCLRHHAADLDFRLVHIVRDSRGVAYSWTKEMARPQAAAGPHNTMARYSSVRAALMWDADNASLDILGRLGTPRLLVRYEDFVADPRGQVQRIAAFAGQPVTSNDLTFLGSTHAELAGRHAIAGNPMRFQHGRVELRRDDAWRSRLPRRQRQIISALTAPLLVRYGYPLGQPA